MYPDLALGLITILSMLTGGVSLPLGVPPEPDPFMQKVAPDECLAYISWAGMAKPKADSENTTEAMLAEPEVQRIIAEVDRRLVEALTAAAEGDEDSPPALLAKHGVSLGRPLLMRPTAIFIEKINVDAGPPDVRGGALVNLGEDAAKIQAELEKLQTQLAGEAVEKVELAGTPAYRLKFGPDAPEITWGVKGVYLIVGIGPESFQGILARVKTDPPVWLTEVIKRSDLQRVSSVIHLDIKTTTEKVLPIIGIGRRDFAFGMQALGLDNAEAISIVSGLDRRGFVSNTHLKIDGAATGLLTFISDKPLTPLDLDHVPADATLAVAVRADAGKVYERFKSVVGGFEPDAPAQIDAELRRMEERTGLKIVDGIFAGLGDVWIAYNSPGEGGVIFTGLTAAVTVRDHDKLQAEYDKIHKLISDEFARMRGFRGGRGVKIMEREFQGEKIHYLIGENDFIFAPAFCLTKEHLIFALNPQNIEAFLSHGEDFQSLATSPHVGPRMKMQGGPSVIVYQDTEKLFKMLYPFLPMAGQMASREFEREGVEFDISLLPSVGAIAPHLNPGLMTIARDRDGITWESRQSLPGGIAGVAAPITLGMMAPSIREARQTARRTQSMNNLKQLGLAMHSYHTANRHFPPAYSTDAEGKPLLSWRVHILPYIEQQDLYDAFHLDEPWDSDHNKKLIARMPATLRAPTSKADPGKTVYVGLRGEGGVLSVIKRGNALEPMRLADIRDGTSNTIMLVEASDDAAVEWTRPDDLKFDPKDPIAGLIGQHKAGFLACFCDGSVHFLPADVESEVLLNLFNRADGNIVPADFGRPRRGRARDSRTAPDAPAPRRLSTQMHKRPWPQAARLWRR